MISKKYRFKSYDGQIRYTMRRGLSKRSSLGVLYTSKPKAGVICSKFAVVISSKVVKSAVERNRIRRRVYSWLENSLLIKNTEKLEPKNYVLIIFNTDIAKSKWDDLSFELSKLYLNQ
jgi:ribonuclease P protein component